MGFGIKNLLRRSGVSVRGIRCKVESESEKGKIRNKGRCIAFNFSYSIKSHQANTQEGAM